MPVYVYVLFNKDGPLAASLIKNGEKSVYGLYGKGTGLSLFTVEENKAIITQAIEEAIANNEQVITSGFKSILAHFQIPLIQGVDYNIYDLCWNVSIASDNGKAAQAVVNKVVDRMATAKPKQWQKIFANASVVYQSIENRGVDIGMVPHKPIWSQSTYSGRSKNLVTNIQGADGTDQLSNPVGGYDDIHIYFDWVAADLRVASILSNDLLLQGTFERSDPYTALHDMLTDDHGTIERDVCKIQLLQAINSFNFDHPTLDEIFVDLGNWLRSSKNILDKTGELHSILDRKFSIKKARNNNHLSVLNGVFQGSVAHAMQLSVKRIWDKYGMQLLVEIHDSISMTSKPEFAGTLIKDVVKIMNSPFHGVLDSDPFFPVKVSIGQRFRKWKPFKIYREHGVENFLDAKTIKKSGQATENGEETQG